MAYKGMASRKILDVADLRVDTISIVCSDDPIFPSGFDVIVLEDGTFANTETYFKGKNLDNIKIWVKTEDEQVIQEIFNSIFSLEGENPSQRADHILAKKVSYIVSLILKQSNFCGGNMRHPVMSDNSYMKSMSSSVFIIQNKQTIRI